jgi:hypothetical protein
MYGIESQNELKGMWKDAVVAELRYFLGICLDGLRKTMKGASAKYESG